jgi:hypothetical protein
MLQCMWLRCLVLSKVSVYTLLLVYVRDSASSQVHNS